MEEKAVSVRSEARWKMTKKGGALRELNPGPAAPETAIIPLDQVPKHANLPLQLC